jgi:uncharacterized membrane protein YfcA
MREQIKDLFSGSWNEGEQRKFAFGFFAGFILNMVGLGIGWLLVKLLNFIGVI